ncbi:MAG TPA: V-type ATP synthase subunit A, partial [Porphyromonadaceae bacterium]|nr:V-type ATP synthase subunit A [Porphyromonadaceae bacterium]
MYKDKLADWFARNVDSEFNRRTNEAMRILQAESELDEIVKLVGMDALSPADRLTMEVARSIREDFLQQDAFSVDDAYS